METVAVTAFGAEMEIQPLIHYTSRMIRAATDILCAAGIPFSLLTGTD
jgi:hypothetical protein